jgi:hypothetical protein
MREDTKMKFAFISRHLPTEGQVKLAKEKGIELVHVGDMDAFTVTQQKVSQMGDFYGVIVVHPAAALRLVRNYQIGVFENANRAPEGEIPQFEAKALHVYGVFGDAMD